MFFFLWNFLTTSLADFLRQTQTLNCLPFSAVLFQEEQKCRLSVLTDASSKIQNNSLLTFDYGFPNFKKRGGYRTWEILSNWAVLTPQRKIHIAPMFTGKPPFTKFFQKTAEGIKRHCMMSTKSNSSTKKFFVIHLRGSDRPCIVKLMTSSYLIRKIESFNVTKNDVIYLMTDLKRENDKVATLKQHVGDSLFMASDMDIFSTSPFK